MKGKRTLLKHCIPVVAGVLLIHFLACAAIAEETAPSRNETTGPAPSSVQLRPFDHNGEAIYSYYQKTNDSYLASTSTERTLDEYYDRRQYPGSPPVIPHEVDEVFTEEMNCLSCHLKGGYVSKMNRHAPVTPHPGQTSCRQCHVTQTKTEPFVNIDWSSVGAPRLGQSSLPGSPPAIPHDLQMRGNCPACHVGAGAVSAIRVSHATRGNCRQCHVVAVKNKVFERTR